LARFSRYAEVCPPAPRRLNYYGAQPLVWIMQSIKSICIKIIIAVRGGFVLAGLLSTLIFISCMDGMAQSDQVTMLPISLAPER
jgi:hypothetical protein